VAGAYLGVGIDEYGNFTNYVDNSQDGIGFKPGTIGLRGAGFIHKDWLRKKYNRSFTDNQVRDICRSGSYNKEKIMAYPYITSAQLATGKYPMYTRDKNRNNAKPISYKIKITPDGLLSVWWSWNGGAYQAMLVDRKITDKNGPLPKDFRFGFAGSTGGSNNNHEVLCFKAAPNSKSEGSASVNLPDARYIEDTQLYLATYNPLYWTGQVTAQSLLKNKDGSLDISKEANWDAACVLDGGVCANKGNQVVAKQPMNERNFVTWNGQNGVALAWNQLSKGQQDTLSQGQNSGESTLAYLKGNQSLEGSGNTPFRTRKSLLGDMINASPEWVGNPKSKQHLALDKKWQDKRYPDQIAIETASSSESYAEYAKRQATRTNVVYIGSNDGFLHGFRSGAYEGERFNSQNNDGKEVLAYMPSGVLARIKNNQDNGLNYTYPQYAHNFFVDGTAGSGDVFYNGQWHTWLVGGLGAGGASVYALDVSNPDSFGSNAKDIVVGEWSHNGKDAVWKNLGNTHGQPQFGRFHNGQWGAVFGNGWCSEKDAANGNCANTNGAAGIYVMLIDQYTGKPSFRFISTGAATGSKISNGIASTSPIDSDDDGIIDYVYAGDLAGNVWRFDLTSHDASAWSNKVQKIFTTQNNQPITTKITVTPSKKQGMVLNFGTGKRDEGYLLEETTYAKSKQSIYGVLDNEVVPGNTTNSVSSNQTAKVLLKELQIQSINPNNNELSKNNIDWKTQKGWYMDLPALNGNQKFEQILYNSVVQGDVLFVNSFIDGNESIISCSNTKSSGFTYALDFTTGAGVDVFNRNKQTPTRQEFGATGTPILINADDRWVMVNKKVSGETEVKEVFFGSSKKGLKRLSWIEMRR
jgi:type IV pilus assembly protein PilY1